MNFDFENILINLYQFRISLLWALWTGGFFSYKSVFDVSRLTVYGFFFWFMNLKWENPTHLLFNPLTWVLSFFFRFFRVLMGFSSVFSHLSDFYVLSNNYNSPRRLTCQGYYLFPSVSGLLKASACLSFILQCRRSYNLVCISMT